MGTHKRGERLHQAQIILFNGLLIFELLIRKLNLAFSPTYGLENQRSKARAKPHSQMCLTDYLVAKSGKIVRLDAQNGGLKIEIVLRRVEPGQFDDFGFAKRFAHQLPGFWADFAVLRRFFGKSERGFFARREKFALGIVAQMGETLDSNAILQRGGEGEQPYERCAAAGALEQIVPGRIDDRGGEHERERESAHGVR